MPLERKYLNNCNGELLIDPDSVFWAIVARNKNTENLKNVLYLYNKVKRKLNVAMQDFRFKTNLTAVYINPTDRCNADCPYCYISAKRRKNGNNMSQEQLEYILQKIDRHFNRFRKKTKNKPMIIYHASEPLLVKKVIFSTMTRYKKNFHFGIQTNSTLLNKKDINFLKTNNISVGVSLDSFDPKINNVLRKSSGSSHFEKTIQAIDYFNGYPGLSVITTITRYNVTHLPKIIEFLHSKRVACVLLNPVRSTRKSTVKLRPNRKLLTKYFIEAVEKSIELCQKSDRCIIIGNFSNIVLGIVAPLGRRLMCDISPCGGGRCFLAIAANGDMIPCGEFIGRKEFSGGNIFNSSVKTALASKAFRKVRLRIVEEIEKCNRCIYRNICGSPCPAELYSLKKNMNEVSPYCEFYKELIEFAFTLIKKNKIKHLFRKEAFGSIKYDYRLCYE